MTSRKSKIVCTALFLLLTLGGVVHAEEAPATGAGGDLKSVVELLTAKKVITAEEAKGLLRRGDATGMQALVELLQKKGVVSSDEAVALGGKAAATAASESSKMLPPSQDRAFIAVLRKHWVANKNRGRDFDEWFADYSDPQQILDKMRAMGAVSTAEANELEKTYHDEYVTGVVSTVMETKEKDYLKRLRNDVAWELDEKITEKLKNDWTRKVRLYGDVRLRYEGDYFGSGNGEFLNPSNPTQILNSTVDRQQMRLRARLGLVAQPAEDFEVGLGIATGSQNNPVSTNVTLGNFFQRLPIQLEKGYLKWTPAPTVTALGGKFANPFLCTELVWDPDINLEGVVLQLTPRLNPTWGLFATAGIIPVQEVELSGRDKWLFAGQLGVDYKRNDNFSAKLAASYYYFTHMTGIVNDPAHPGQTDWTAPAFQQKGNTLMDIDPGPGIKTAYASDFHVLNVTGLIDLGYWQPVHVQINGDYVKNLGFDQSQVSQRAGFDVKEETTGYRFGIAVGHPELQERWDWKAQFVYKYLESDAVVDAFTDSDFHLGGTNAKGWIAGADLGLGKNVWLSTRWLSANEISGPQFSVDVLQVDLNAKF